MQAFLATIEMAMIGSVHINTQLSWQGGEQQTFALVEGLARRGHPAVLAASPRSELFRRARAAGIEVCPIHAWNEVDPQAVARLAALLRRRRPAILHLHTSHAHLLGLLAASLSPPVRRVVARRVGFSIYRHSFLGLNWLKYRFGVDRYIAVSGAVGSLLEREGVPRERIRVVRSGVDPRRFSGMGEADPGALLRELALPPGLPIVASVGALKSGKGHRFLVEAARRVLREREAAFIVVGEGPRRRSLLRLARRRGVSSRFRLLGFRTDVGRLLAASSLFVFPSLEEGLGTSLLDALLLERPVVATRVGGIPEVVAAGDHGLLVPPGDPEPLAAAILEALADPAAARERAHAGRERVLSEFSVDRMVEGTLSVYGELVG
jgi:glycosyltransferase involved in cell wall biosynthesis